MTFPEHDKLHVVLEKSQAAGEFFEWLTGEKGYELAKQHVRHDDECFNEEGDCVCGILEGTFYPAPINLRKLLAEFFDIDEAKLEEEKRAVLAELHNKEKRS